MDNKTNHLLTFTKEVTAGLYSLILLSITVWCFTEYLSGSLGLMSAFAGFLGIILISPAIFSWRRSFYEFWGWREDSTEKKDI